MPPARKRFRPTRARCPPRSAARRCADQRSWCARCPRLKVLWWISCWDVSESLRGREYIRWLLRFLPAPQLLGLAQIAERLALGTQRRLGGGKPPPESLARDSQRILGVHLQGPSERDDREQQIAHLLESAVVVCNLGQLLRLLRHGLGRRRRSGEVEP